MKRTHIQRLVNDGMKDVKKGNIIMLNKKGEKVTRKLIKNKLGF